MNGHYKTIQHRLTCDGLQVELGARFIVTVDIQKWGGFVTGVLMHIEMNTNGLEVDTISHHHNSIWHTLKSKYLYKRDPYYQPSVWCRFVEGID